MVRSEGEILPNQTVTETFADLIGCDHQRERERLAPTLTSQHGRQEGASDDRRTAVVADHDAGAGGGKRLVGGEQVPRRRFPWGRLELRPWEPSGSSKEGPRGGGGGGLGLLSRAAKGDDARAVSRVL